MFRDHAAAAFVLLAAATPAACWAQASTPDISPRPVETDALIDAARAAARGDRNREAADLFGRAIEAATPDKRPQLLQEYADQLTYSDRAAQAVPLYEEALKADLPADVRLRALKGLGLALLWSDQPTRARPVYEDIVRQQPGDQDARRNLGRALSWSGRQREAIAYLQVLLRDHPDDQEARVQLAQAQAWLGLPDEAARTLAGVTSPRDDARKLREELDRSRAQRSYADAQRSHQSDDVDIQAWRLGHAVSFAEGRGMAGVRLDRTDYERSDGTDSARVLRPMLQGRYRFSPAFELNGEVGQDRIEMRDGTSHQPAVYSSWLTWWPNDLLRFDLSTNRGTFDNLKSLELGLTVRQNGLSMDFTPTERQRYTVRAEQGWYSDGNARTMAQVDGEYRVRTHPDVWVGARYMRFEFDKQLDNGYFNPLAFNAAHVTLRAAWRPDGPEGRWDVTGYAAYGREHAVPDGDKPAYDLSLRVGYRFDPRTRLEARAQRFSSRTTNSGFGRTILGLALDRSW